MSSSVESLTAVRVLVAWRDGQLIAIPMARIGRALAVRCSPRIPATAAWLAGAARLEAAVLWLIDLPGGSSPEDQALVLLAAGEAPHWALRIDRIDRLSTAVAGGPPAWEGWPTAWARGCLLADGRRGTLIDPDAVDRLIGHEAA